MPCLVHNYEGRGSCPQCTRDRLEDRPVAGVVCGRHSVAHPEGTQCPACRQVAQAEAQALSLLRQAASRGMRGSARMICLVHNMEFPSEGVCPVCAGHEFNRSMLIGEPYHGDLSDLERRVIERTLSTPEPTRTGEFYRTVSGRVAAVRGPDGNVRIVSESMPGTVTPRRCTLYTCPRHGEFFTEERHTPTCPQCGHTELLTQPNELQARYNALVTLATNSGREGTSTGAEDGSDYESFYTARGTRFTFSTQHSDDQDGLAGEVHAFMEGFFTAWGTPFAIVGFHHEEDGREYAYQVGFDVEDPWRNIVVRTREVSGVASIYYVADVIHFNMRYTREYDSTEKRPDPAAKPARRIRARDRKGGS